MSDLSVIVRRTIRASRERVFAAWTEAELLPQWWGPQGVDCPAYEVDLRPGGVYRIANETPDGLLWIRGTFETVDVPRCLVYTWAHEPVTPQSEVSRVTVRFEAVSEDITEVIVVHDRLATPRSREVHGAGWRGCLSGLEAWAEGSR